MIFYKRVLNPEKALQQHLGTQHSQSKLFSTKKIPISNSMDNIDISTFQWDLFNRDKQLQIV